jgi:hypothetical protein
MLGMGAEKVGLTLGSWGQGGGHEGECFIFLVA